MIDKDKVSQAVSEMCENPDWKDVLMNAPGAANLRVALAFYASKNLNSMSNEEKDEYRQFREMLESQLNAEELKYLTDEFGRMGVEAAQKHYSELLQKKHGQEGSGLDAGGNQPQAPVASGQQVGGEQVQGLGQEG